MRVCPYKLVFNVSLLKIEELYSPILSILVMSRISVATWLCEGGGGTKRPPQGKYKPPANSDLFVASLTTLTGDAMTAPLIRKLAAADLR